MSSRLAILIAILFGGAFTAIGGWMMCDSIWRFWTFPSEISGYRQVSEGDWKPQATKQVSFGRSGTKAVQVGRLFEREVAIIDPPRPPFYVRRWRSAESEIRHGLGRNLDVWRGVRNPRWDQFGILAGSLVFIFLGGLVFLGGLLSLLEDLEWKGARWREQVFAKGGS